MDGSRIEGSNAFQFCALEGNGMFHEHQSHLSRTLFQVALQAIVEAMQWAHNKSSKVYIYSDSQSSIKALNNLYTGNSIVRYLILN